MPERMRMVPRRNQGVICSLSSHQAKMMVVTGLKYTQLVATTAPSLRMTQFQSRKQTIEAMTPRNRMFQMMGWLKMTSREGNPGTRQ